MDQIMDVPGFDKSNAKSPSRASRTLGDEGPASRAGTVPAASGQPRQNRNMLRRSSEIAALQLIPDPKTTGELELAQRVRHARVHEGSLGMVQSLAAQFANHAVGHVVEELENIKQVRDLNCGAGGGWGGGGG